ncbi:hypothetical protein GCM10022243_49050 [Saccharothrix violaceirubra]|uniref:Uncharacterized protein n=1 Tax=Saccharothrix violaceirubra TaxID=413306 RepID=A0A7W7WUG1_9PSEU|nr:hypothetical protein [Saccharothrix violaceirubra]MBB4963752.1 hypothetical protein [Saccharothrix violaceirubra]
MTAPDPETTAARDLATAWCTLPGWTRAHALIEIGSMGAVALYSTGCERDYRPPDPEVDEPIVAPDDMPRCKRCLRRSEERAS